ncbi:MAG: hypothetical protein IIV68_05980 [Alistipes sp.]|nr:hypothetical protein [Alistipes sp.]
MKRLFLFLPLVTSTLPLLAANETSAGDVKRWVVFITLFVIVLAIAAHTIYLLATTKKLKENYTVEAFRKNRAAAGLGAMTKEEVDELNTKLDSIDTIWGEIADSKGNMVVYPHSRKSLNQSLEILNAAIALNPDNKDIVTKINDYNEVLNHALTRQFSGSKTIIAIATILGLILGFGTGFYMAIVATIVTVLAYILASYTPNFMLIEQIARNGKRSTSLVKRLLLALIGSVTVANQNDKDKSERWVSYLLLFVGTIVMAFLLPIIALVNYLRNYVIYR